jgi:hypothetical protein
MFSASNSMWHALFLALSSRQANPPRATLCDRTSDFEPRRVSRRGDKDQASRASRSGILALVSELTQAHSAKKSGYAKRAS